MEKQRRILLKLSGEALGGKSRRGIEPQVLERICRVMGKCMADNVGIAVVVGGGNYFRGRSSAGMNRCRADQMGMLATMMNALAIGDQMDQLGLPNVVLSAVNMAPIAEFYDYRKANAALAEGKAVILGAGTGSPFFSTDTAAALRAAELGAQEIFKGSTVDGVYDKDPKEFPDAVRQETLRFGDILGGGYGVVLDAAAAALCQENRIRLRVFSLEDPEQIWQAVNGEAVGTVIKEEHWT